MDKPTKCFAANANQSAPCDCSMVCKYAPPGMPIAGRMLDDWKPDERTVRACIEALLPANARCSQHTADTVMNCVAALESLLPKKDRAKELVEEYRQTFKRPDIVACCLDDELEFAEWLISTRKLP